jgi:hypothetical protein
MGARVGSIAGGSGGSGAHTIPEGFGPVLKECDRRQDALLHARIEASAALQASGSSAIISSVVGIGG